MSAKRSKSRASRTPGREPLPPEFTSRDLKEISRFVGKYGRERVLAKVKEISLPRPRQRPKTDPEEAREYLEDVVYCLWKWTEEYRAEGSKTAVDDAFRDLYLVTVEDEKQRTKGHYERWVQTIKRKRSPVRRTIESYLKRARDRGSGVGREKAER
jgi:hypothetical protein